MCLLQLRHLMPWQAAGASHVGHLFKEGPSRLEGSTSRTAVGLCVLGSRGVRGPWGAERRGSRRLCERPPIVPGDACCPLGPGPRKESPWGCFRGTWHSEGGELLPSCHRVGVAGGRGGVWGWWSGHLEGPGGGLPLRGRGAGLAGKNVREPLRKSGCGGSHRSLGPGRAQCWGQPWGRPLPSALPWPAPRAPQGEGQRRPAAPRQGGRAGPGSQVLSHTRERGGLGAALGVGHLPGDALPRSLFLRGVVCAVLLR